MKRHVSFHTAILAAIIGCAFAAPPAQAGPNLQSFIMDDDLLLYHTYGTRDYAMGTMKRIGVDGVRVTVSWKFVSGEEGGRPKRQPAKLRGKRAENPRNYRRDIWDRFDDIARLGRDHGLTVLFNVTGPGPVWAHGKAPYSRRFDQPAWRPRVSEFRRFVKAVGKRYSGTYRDENQNRGVLPKISMWSVWNEPNQPASLSPQLEYNRRLRRQVPVAPVLYRDLYYAGTDALRETGHGQDVILMGETAPLGAVRNTPRVHMWPKQFMRELFCLRPNGTPFRGRDAAVRRCETLRRKGPFLLTGWAHHPYTQRNSPTRRDRHRDSVNMANVGELPALLDTIADRTGLIPKGLPVALTEAGWETRPPDPTRGVPVKRQAEYINVAERLAYEEPRVTVSTQFILRDVKPRRQYRGRRKYLSQYWATWQSGLLYANGSAKPALGAYLMPFDIRGAGGRLRAWGQLKFLPNGHTEPVYLQFRPAGSGNWRTVGAPLKVENPMGFWETELDTQGPGVWRAVVSFVGRWWYSREVSLRG